MLVFAYNPSTHAAESKTNKEAETSLSIHKENIVVLLDASGSMNDPFSATNQDNEAITKIQVAKEALETVLNQLAEDVNIGLLVFSVAHSDPWLYPLGTKDEVRFLSALSTVEAGGGTPLARYMKFGADTLLAQRERQFNYGSYRLLIITDGQANRPNWSAPILRQLRIGRFVLMSLVSIWQRSILWLRWWIAIVKWITLNN